MKKKIIVFLLVAVLLTMSICLCACNEKSKIDAVEGEFYTLQQAYDNGWLDKTDLKNIAYHLNGTKPIGFVPKDLAQLSPVDERTLKIDVANRCEKVDGAEAITTDDVSIRGYYGTYNELVAVIVDVTGYEHFDVITTETAGGVTFTYSNTNKIRMWKKH